MTDHTPGPWKWDDYELRSVSSGEVVLSPCIPHMYSEPNGRLIAAAPDLLEACVEAIQGLDAEFNQSSTDVNFPLLRAAVAKATGAP